MSNKHSDNSQLCDGVTLCGLDGTSPLGFLAALGTLQVLSATNCNQTVTLAWQRSDNSWVPMICGVDNDSKLIASSIAENLGCPFQPDQQKDQERATTQLAHEAKLKELKEKNERLKKRGLRGNQRKEAIEKELGPIRQELATLRYRWLAALRGTVPSLEIALGKHLNAKCDELRSSMLTSLEDSSLVNRTAIDLLAAFGSDICSLPKDDRMQPTPFCFITGSGHQNFLDTVRQLMEHVDALRLEHALFSRREPTDETLSMRWDPQEDRRYAVMWSDPTASDNKATTNWALNLLAYRGLQLCTCVAYSRKLRTVGWVSEPEAGWRWPIWQNGLTADIVRSTLSNPILATGKPSRDLVSAIGIIAVYQSNRVQVGNFTNFTPAHQIA